MLKYRTFCFLLIVVFVSDLFPKEGYLISEILEIALKENLEIKAYKKQIDASTEIFNRAGAIVNPELEIGLENFGANEIEVVLTQSFELGGKRKGRVSSAEKEINLKKLDLERKKNEIIVEVYKNIIPIILLNRNEIIIDSIYNLIDETYLLIKNKVNAGASSKIDELRASMELDRLDLEKNIIDVERSAQLKKLASIINLKPSDLIAVSGKMVKDIKTPNIIDCNEKLKDHPQLKILKVEEEVATLETIQAKKDAVPDLQLSGGYLRNNESSENSIILGASIDLPIFSRNRGEINSLKIIEDAKKVENSQIIKNMESEIANIINDISLIDSKISTVKDKLLPKSDEVFNLLLGFYKLGAVSFIEVLNAEREKAEFMLTLNELESQRCLLFVDLYGLTNFDFEILED